MKLVQKSWTVVELQMESSYHRIEDSSGKAVGYQLESSGLLQCCGSGEGEMASISSGGKNTPHLKVIWYRGVELKS